MRVMIVGAGGLGGYLGFKLAQAGADVALVARGRHLEALRARGLALRSGEEDGVLRIPAHEAPREAGPADVILLCVKLYDTASALDACRSVMTDTTIVATLQNGVDGLDQIASSLGARHAFAGAAYVSARIEEPGVVRHVGAAARLEFGGLRDDLRVPAQRFVELCRRAGLGTEPTPDIIRTLWEKFTFFSATSGLTALTRQPLGAVRDDPVAAPLLHAAVHEAAAVARALGVAVGPDLEATTIATVTGKSAQLKPSLLVDLERGKRLEVDWISGAIHRLGARHGVPTPVQSCVFAALKPFSGGV